MGVDLVDDTVVAGSLDRWDTRLPLAPSPAPEALTEGVLPCVVLLAGVAMGAGFRAPYVNKFHGMRCICACKSFDIPLNYGV